MSKKNPPDLTKRNEQHVEKRINRLTERVSKLEKLVKTFFKK